MDTRKHRCIRKLEHRRLEKTLSRLSIHIRTDGFAVDVISSPIKTQILDFELLSSRPQQVVSPSVLFFSLPFLHYSGKLSMKPPETGGDHDANELY